MPRYTWLLFDADGTLFDFDKAEEQALELVLTDLKYPVSDAAKQTYKRINKELWHAFELGRVTQGEIKVRRFQLWLEQLGLEHDAEATGHNYVQHLSEQTDLLPGAQELVEMLADRYRMVIVTNGLKEVQRPRMQKSSLSPFFEDVIISGELGVAKPDPRFFDAAFARMGQPSREHVLMVGDSLSADMQGGLQYGLDTCWCNFRNEKTELPVTHTVTQLEQLADLLST